MARIVQQGIIQVAGSGETGVQVNEFEAAIKSVTSATTVGAVFIYDTRNDSDGGAWRKKCAGLSWFDETLNTATRGGRREFPSVALLVADNATGAGGITVYDLDDPSMPMFMVFSKSGTSVNSQSLCSTDDQISCVYALNGRIYFGTSSGGDFYGLRECNLTTDTYSITNAGDGERVSPSSDRNAVHDWLAIPVNAAKKLANNSVNDIAATIVEGAEIGALGLPIPTVAVACGSGSSGGLSVIHPNGDVYDKATTSAAATLVEFDKDGNLYAGQGQYISRFDLSTLYADASNVYLNVYENNGTLVTIREFANASIPSLVGNTDSLAITDNGFAGGSSSGLTQVLFNDGDHEESAVAYITSSYNTGYMLGDIRFAGLTDVANADRSVKGNLLTVHNASASDYVEKTAVATNAELKAYSNFSTDNYLTRAYDADFDFGTGDFSIMLWIKEASNSVDEYIISRSTSGSSSHPGFYGRVNTNGTTTWFSNDGSTEALVTSTQTIDDATWHQIVFLRRSGRTALFIDGREIGSSTNAAGNMDNSSAVLEIGRLGVNGSTTSPLTNGSLSLVRISATAPTPTQVADIYREEAKLFRSGAKCLLFANVVKDLAYDNSTGLLSVGQDATTGQDGVVNFRGLEKVSSFQADDYSDWSANTTHKLAAAGGVSVYGRTSGTGGVIVDLPPFDVRGDTNIADSKLPDDGKIHFTGVTTNATPTVIGHIPIAEDEHLYIKSVVNAGKYNAKTSERASFEVDAQFVRKIGDDVNTPIELRKLSDEQYSTTFDVVWERDTASNTARLKVTGVAGMRFEWSADITVQRISDKTYER